MIARTCRLPVLLSTAAPGTLVLTLCRPIGLLLANAIHFVQCQTMRQPTKPLRLAEFVTLLALMVAILAMATDIMLPALDTIGRDLDVADPNDAQLVVSSLFVGFAVGQLLVGPLADSFGRKPVIYAGYVIFISGCLLSMFATSFAMMLFGRVLQGLGAAGPRIISISIVRDGYEGRAMARIMSIIMAVFILVPAVAPAMGQGVMLLAGWRSTFAMPLLLAIIAFAWFAARQPETLAPDARRAFSLANIASAIAEACSDRVVIGYTIATGLIFGAFLGYLSSAQQIFTVTFGKGPQFPLYFAVAAIAIGAASVMNSMLVMRLGMRLLTYRALVGISVISAVFLVPTALAQGVPPLWLFMTWLLVIFFCTGILFGNLNALAMEPLGHMAGLGAALVGSIATFISLPLGWLVGNTFDGGVSSLVAGFAVFGCAAIAVMRWVERMAPFAVR